MRSKFANRIMGLSLLLALSFTNVLALDGLYAGIRCSHYGFGDAVPDEEWLGNAAESMASRWPGSTPAFIWIADSFIWEDWDVTEFFLSYFDEKGYKAIIQVEPGDQDMIDVIDEWLGGYGHHECVIGFGVDIEWYQSDNNPEGKKVTDAEARAWRQRVQLHNPEYILMVKHFFPAWLPPTERKDILFIDDSQQFPSFHKFLNENDDGTSWNVGYKVWTNFVENEGNGSGGMSGMQYGYDDPSPWPEEISDKDWWSLLDDPQKEIGDSCLASGSSTNFLIWVDFTSYEFDWEIWDVSTESIKTSKITPVKIYAKDNRITIEHNSFTTSKNTKVELYDLSGKLLYDKSYTTASKAIRMDLNNSIAAGNYMLKVISDNQKLSGKIVLK